MPETLRALAFNCTLKKTHGASSTQVLLGQVAEALRPHGVETEFVRAVDFNILPGVTSNEGRGDAWPALRRKVFEFVQHKYANGTSQERRIGSLALKVQQVADQLDEFEDMEPAAANEARRTTGPPSPRLRRAR